MITITSYYGNSASAENNAKRVSVAGTSFFFSYETLVAVRNMNGTRVVQNQWGPTTGKHLNAIDGGNKSNRLTPDEFQDYVDSLEISQVINGAFA
jgi:hypothetical protein